MPKLIDPLHTYYSYHFQDHCQTKAFLPLEVQLLTLE